MVTVKEVEKLNWQKLVAPYAQPDLRRSLWQIANTLLPFMALFAAMLWSVRVSYLLTLALAAPAAGFWVRTFIIFHDCCHGSFFKTKQANESVGIVLGFVMLTPFYQWRHEHAIHHATAGNIDKRYTGDVPTMTVAEYRAASWSKKAGYRIMRNPFILFTVGSTLLFTVLHRFSPKGAAARERWSVLYTDAAVMAFVGGVGLLVGFKTLLLAALPMVALATSVGVWLFYVQHQFEGVYWETKERWDFVQAGLQGSSYYRLPRVLQWFTGNIGFHHIHHLSPKVPNYRLEACHKANPPLQVKPLSIMQSFKGARLHLIDDRTKQLVGWDVLRRDAQSAPS